MKITRTTTATAATRTLAAMTNVVASIGGDVLVVLVSIVVVLAPGLGATFSTSIPVDC